MTEVRNWCCKTEGLEPQEIQDYFDYAVVGGAEADEVPLGTKSDFIYQGAAYHASNFIYFGVNNGCTYFDDFKDRFDDKAVELKPSQIKHYINTGEVLEEPKELPEDKGNGLTDGVCEVLEQPLNNQDLLFYITEALLRPDEVTYTERRKLAKLLSERGIARQEPKMDLVKALREHRSTY